MPLRSTDASPSTTRLPTLRRLMGGRPLVGLDVGAAGGVPSHWRATGDLLEVHACEPNRDAWGATSVDGVRVHWHGDAVAGTSGPRDLYVTNRPTGSSLIPPDPKVMGRFTTASGYHGVARVERVDCLSIPELRATHAIAPFDLIKLDTQGTEHEILCGLDAADWSVLQLAEIEVEFQPMYRDQPLFADLHVLMADHGFELLDLRTHREYRVGPSGQRGYLHDDLGASAGSPRLGAQLVAGDAVYVREPDAVLNAGVEHLARHVVAAMLYTQHDLALWLIDRASNVDMLDDEARHALRSEVIDHAPRPRPRERGGRAGIVARKILRRISPTAGTRQVFWTERRWPDQ